MNLIIGGRYNWKGQPERLIFMGRRRYGYVLWNQFESFLQQKVDELERELCYLRTAIRNAVTELEEDNIDGARATLLDVVDY